MQATKELERQAQGIRDKQKALRGVWMDDEKEKGASKGKDCKGKRPKQEAWNDKLHDNIRQRKWKDESSAKWQKNSGKGAKPGAWWP